MNPTTLSRDCFTNNLRLKETVYISVCVCMCVCVSVQACAYVCTPRQVGSCKLVDEYNNKFNVFQFSLSVLLLE